MGCLLKTFACATVAAVVAFVALPLTGWSADTSEAVVNAGYSLANLQVDITTTVVVAGLVVGMLAAVAKFILAVVGVLSKSQERKAICTQLIMEIDKLKHSVDDVEDRADETPAATLRAGIKKWKKTAPDRVTEELDRLIGQVRGVKK